MSNSVRPHRRQPTRLPRTWDSPGKNSGVGCHFLVQCRKVKSESEVAQSCPTLSDPMDCSLPGSSIHGIFQARVLEWGAIAFSKRNGIDDVICKTEIIISNTAELEKEMATHSCSCLENPRDGGAWWAVVSGVAQSRTPLKRLSISSSSNTAKQLAQLSPHLVDQ